MFGKLLSRSQVAAILGVTRRTVDRLRKAGLLPWIDVAAGRGRRPLVRFDPGAIEDFLRANRKEVQHDCR